MIKKYGKTQHKNTMLKLTFLSYILNPTNNYSQASSQFTSVSTNSQALPRIHKRLQKLSQGCNVERYSRHLLSILLPVWYL